MKRQITPEFYVDFDSIDYIYDTKEEGLGLIMKSGREIQFTPKDMEKHPDFLESFRTKFNEYVQIQQTGRNSK